MGLVYIEYISRRAGVDLASFHADATAGQAERELIFSCKGPAPGRRALRNITRRTALACDLQVRRTVCLTTPWAAPPAPTTN